MNRRRLAAFVLVGLAGCGATDGKVVEEEAGAQATPRWTYESTREIPPGPGLLSGEDGEFTLDDLRR
jgi:hypothetical protein